MITEEDLILPLSHKFIDYSFSWYTMQLRTNYNLLYIPAPSAWIKPNAYDSRAPSWADAPREWSIIVTKWSLWMVKNCTPFVSRYICRLSTTTSKNIHTRWTSKDTWCSGMVLGNILELLQERSRFDSHPRCFLFFFLLLLLLLLFYVLFLFSYRWFISLSTSLFVFLRSIVVIHEWLWTFCCLRASGC